MCAPSFEKLQCTDFWKTPRATQLVHLGRDQCTVCLNASGRSFSIILCITAVDFSIQTDVCQVRMVGPQIYISTATEPKLVSAPNKMWPKSIILSREKYWPRTDGKQIWIILYDIRRQVLSKCSVIANLENAQNCRDSYSIDRNQLD